MSYDTAHKVWIPEYHYVGFQDHAEQYGGIVREDARMKLYMLYTYIMKS